MADETTGSSRWNGKYGESETARRQGYQFPTGRENVPTAAAAVSDHPVVSTIERLMQQRRKAE